MNRDDLSGNPDQTSILSFVLVLVIGVPICVYVGHVAFEHYLLWQVLLMPRSMDDMRWMLISKLDAFTFVGSVIGFLVLPYLGLNIRRRFLVQRYLRFTNSDIPWTSHNWISIPSRHDLMWAISSTLALTVIPIGLALFAGLFAVTVFGFSGLLMDGFLPTAIGTYWFIKKYIAEFFTSPEFEAFIHSRSLLDGIHLSR